ARIGRQDGPAYSGSGGIASFAKSRLTLGWSRGHNAKHQVRWSPPCPRMQRIERFLERRWIRHFEPKCPTSHPPSSIHRLSALEERPAWETKRGVSFPGFEFGWFDCHDEHEPDGVSPLAFGSLRGKRGLGAAVVAARF